jgi:hypothetical protein
LSGSIAVKFGRGARVAATLLALLAAAVGCSHEKKKTDAQALEPPKLRSAAERQTSTAQARPADSRPTLGMRMSEVETIQGKPDRVDVMTYPGPGETLEEWRWLSLDNGCRTVVFTNKRATLLRECVGASNTAGAGSP